MHAAAELLDKDDVPPSWKTILDAANAAKKAQKSKGKGVRKNSATRRM